MHDIYALGLASGLTLANISWGCKAIYLGYVATLLFPEGILHLQEKVVGAQLSVNFGVQLSEAFGEIKLWSSLGFSISNSARQVEADTDQLRLLRGKATLLSNQYNQVHLELGNPIHPSSSQHTFHDANQDKSAELQAISRKFWRNGH